MKSLIMKEEFIIKFVQVKNQFKCLHWQTFSYSKHKAYDKVQKDLDELIDEFVETMMGKYGRPEFPGEFAIMFQDINRLSMQNFLDNTIEFFLDMSNELDPSLDSDLLNIRDEMMGTINKLKYLLTLE
jgi:hypothetical protein